MIMNIARGHYHGREGKVATMHRKKWVNHIERVTTGYRQKWVIDVERVSHDKENGRTAQTGTRPSKTPGVCMFVITEEKTVTFRMFIVVGFPVLHVSIRKRKKTKLYLKE